MKCNDLNKYICMLIALCSFSLQAKAQTTVALPGGTSTDTLQIIYPTDSIFMLEPGNRITTDASAVVGNDSQNWQFTNRGVITAGTTTAGSGLKLGSREPGITMVINEDSIVSLSTQGNGPSGIQFTNGGRITNAAGGWIEGYDGVHTDHASISVDNSSVIHGNHGGGSTVYSGEGALVVNQVGGQITGVNYGISVNGNNTNAEIHNYGIINTSNSAFYLYHGNVYALYNAPGAWINSGGGKTINLDGSRGYMLNKGKITASGTALFSSNDGGNNVYVNVDSIIASNGYAIETDVIDKGNRIYNLGVLDGSAGSVLIQGDSTQLVLGQTAYLPQLNEYVTGTGSKLNGNAISTGLHNTILLTDTGAEDHALSGFHTLAMNGTGWALAHPLTLSDSLIIHGGNLTLGDSLTLTETHAAVIIQNNGTLTLPDSVKITLPNSAVFRVETGGLLNIQHTRSDSTGYYLTIPYNTIISGTVQFDSLLVINHSLTLAGATLNLHPGTDTLRVNGVVDLTNGNNRINLSSYNQGVPYTILTATGGITGDASHFTAVSSGGAILPVCNYEITVTTDTITLLLKDGSVSISEQPAGGIVRSGRDYTFQVQAAGENISYAWYKDGVQLPGESVSTLTVRNANLFDQGSYHVVVANECYTVTSESAYLIVEIPVPVGNDQVESSGMKAYPNPVSDQLYIEGGSSVIRSIVVFNSVGQVVYQASSQSASHSVNVADWSSGIYLLKTTDANGHSEVRKVIRK